ncbi:MAG: Crp/Fnr family transcriptional regulator, partial [Bacteroidales bacterium]|nr:Crp/Fnr family transcriptional regulator [Bacteroidales bacterium]
MNTRLPQFTEPDLLQKIEEEGDLIHYAAGEIILQPGKRIKIVPLILHGSVKVLRVDNNGNELFLYYLTQGQSCASSLSAFMNDKLSTIKALAESDTDLIAIPMDKALLWFNEYRSWRKFVLQTMESRFEQLIHTVDTIAFSKIDDRLISFLINKSQNNGSNTIK